MTCDKILIRANFRERQGTITNSPHISWIHAPCAVFQTSNRFRVIKRDEFCSVKIKKDEENGLLFSFLNQKKEDICVDSNTACYKPSNATNYNLCSHRASCVHMVKQVANVIHLF